jgi:hypothetical protein
MRSLQRGKIRNWLGMLAVVLLIAGMTVAAMLWTPRGQGNKNEATRREFFALTDTAHWRERLSDPNPIVQLQGLINYRHVASEMTSGDYDELCQFIAAHPEMGTDQMDLLVLILVEAHDKCEGLLVRSLSEAVSKKQRSQSDEVGIEIWGRALVKIASAYLEAIKIDEKSMRVDNEKLLSVRKARKSNGETWDSRK